jgi:hypothetical protein
MSILLENLLKKVYKALQGRKIGIKIVFLTGSLIKIYRWPAGTIEVESRYALDREIPSVDMRSLQFHYAAP